MNQRQAQLHVFPVLFCASGEPHHKAVGQEALYGWPIEIGQQDFREVGVFWLPEKVESLLGLSHLVSTTYAEDEVLSVLSFSKVHNHFS